jgi:hypothetical protein
VQAKAIAEAMRGAAHEQFGGGVGRTDCLHRSSTQGADMPRFAGAATGDSSWTAWEQPTRRSQFC